MTNSLADRPRRQRPPPVASAPAQRFFRPTWAEVDLDALGFNLRRFKAAMPPGVRMMFVVKGDAYGHGAVALARWTQERHGADWLGVSSVEEGIALREAGVRLPVLILGSLFPFESFLAAAQYGLTPTVASMDGARRLCEVSRKLQRRVSCHLKLDTGMGRIGMSWPSGLEVARVLASERGVELEGVYTHLASADADGRQTRAQLDRFKAALKDMAREGIRVRLRHAANSIAALDYSSSRWDLVRPGLALYGLAGRGYHPILTLKTRVVFLKTVRRGTPIGYGATFKARREARVATLPIGYADGLPRLLSNRGHVLIDGRRCPIIGAVSMDMTTVDVGAAPSARVGSEAVLLGSSGGLGVGVAQWADWARTIPYEVVARLSARVPRVYLQS